MPLYASRRETLRLEEFLYSLHSCASPDEVYEVVDKGVGAFVHARGYGWYRFAPGTMEPCVIKARGVSERFLARYEHEGRKRDPLFRRVAQSLTAACSDIDLSQRDRRRFTFQERISSGQVGHAIEAPLVINGELAGTFNVSREPHQRPFGQAEVERTAIVARHASLAIAHAQKISELDQRSAILQSTCDLFSAPLIVSEGVDRICFANWAAHVVIERRGEAITSGLRIADAMLGADAGSLATVFVPFVNRDNIGLILRSARLSREGAIASIISEGRREDRVPKASLSARERDIVELVARGLSNIEIAKATSVSRNTVKQHLKHVFAKSGVRSRAELAARFAAEHQVTAFRGAAQQIQSSDAIARSLRPERP